jgi:hypothetical protein
VTPYSLVDQVPANIQSTAVKMRHFKSHVTKRHFKISFVNYGLDRRFSVPGKGKDFSLKPSK